jgi:hypothetical protein
VKAKKETSIALMRRLRRDVQNLADWQEADSWKGGGDPAEEPGIEAGFAASKKRLRATLREIGKRLK